MAFAKQYYSSYKSNNNLDYYLEVFVENFDSSATEITIGAGGPIISYETDQEDRFSPILSSQCALPFMVKDTSTQAFIQLLRTTYQERQVYLHLYRATSSTYTTTKPIWSGFLVMDLGSGEDVSFPYEQKLTFVDGLSLLKDIDFVDLSNEGSETNIQGSYTKENMYYGPAIYTYWIKEILLKTGCATTTQGVSIDYGFTTAVNWYNADMQNTNQGSDPLGLTQCVVSMFHTKNDQDVFTPQNCYTVLKELLRHWGARITYWKHEFWIVQIPEYIQDESGLLDNPDNINSRQYNRFGTLTGSQDHLGDTYYTRYEQTIQSNQVSKLVGTKYNYLPMIHNAEADFLSFASKNYYGGFPYGVSAESQEVFQGTIIDPSTANFLWLSVPLNWVWDMSGSSLSHHEKGWWCSVKFNFYASDGTTTYYLQYDSSNGGSYYWVLEADWTPLGNTSPKYIIKSTSLTESNYIGFQEDIPFVDSSGSAIAMNGAWSFFLDIEDFANQSSSGNNGSFFCRFSGYAPSSHYSYVKHDPYQEFPYLPTTGDVSGGGPQTKSGTVSWSNTLENPSGVLATSFSTPVGFDAGTSQADIQFVTSSPFKGFLQTLNTTQSASFGLSLNSQINNSTNTEKFSFGTLLWGDAIQQFAVGCLRVNNGSSFVKTNPDGEWGRGTLSGDNTFTELLIDEFLSGQIKVVISPTMRLAVGEENKNQTATGTSGSTTRPRYVNPIGRLRESRTNETDPEYIFRRGSFHSLYDEWDYEGYQILRDTVSSTTTTTDIGDLGGSQDNNPISNAKLIGNVNNALMMNSPVAYLRTTVPATGSNVAVNGNFNVATGWTVGTGWSIDTTNKKASFTATGSTSDLTQSVLTQGLTYQVNFQVVVTAGSLLVKAGSSGTTQTITASGDYSIYLDCDGSNLIKFQAATTFTGNITFITLRDQKSLSSVPINSIGSTVFKTNDTFNLVNSLGGEILTLTVTSNQGATDDTISVTSTALFDDIGIDSVLLINQDDLSAQYQNKTKGTVAGFGIDADGISKGGIEITGWLNSDTMTGAAVTNVPTALSVKNYVDSSVGASDTLAEVLANGNVTGGTNISVNDNDKITFGAGADLQIYHDENNSYIDEAGVGLLYLRGDAGINITAPSGGEVYAKFVKDAGCEFRFNDGTKLVTTNTGISITGGGVFSGDVTSSGTINVNRLAGGLPYDNFKITTADIVTTLERLENTGDANAGYGRIDFKTNATTGGTAGRGGFKFIDGAGSDILYLENSDKSATFTGLVSGITPTVDANFATKSYVDSQIIANDSLEEVTSVGNSTSYGIEFTSTNFSIGQAKIGLYSNDYVYLRGGANGLVIASGDGVVRHLLSTNAHIFEISGEKMRLDSSNRLGLGTSNPQELLDVNTNVTGLNVENTAAIFGNDVGTTQSRDTWIKMRASGATTDRSWAFGSNQSGDFRFNYLGDRTIAPTSGSSFLIIKNTGSLLIGTTTEREKLTVQGNIQAQDGGVLAGIGAGKDGFVFHDLYTGGGDYWGYQARTGGIGSRLALCTNGSEQLTIDGNGLAIFSGLVSGITPTADANFATKSYVDAQISANDSLQEVTTVGNTTTNSIMIGTSDAPLSTLHLKDGNVLSSAYNDASLIIEGFSKSVFQMASYNTGFCQIAFGDQNDGFDGGILYSNASRYMSFEAANAEKMRLTSGGELCVGYTSNQGLTAKFLVNGNGYFSGNIYPAGGILIEDGSSAAPSLRFNNDTDTGLYRDTANTLGIAGSLSATGSILPASNIGSSLGSSSKSFLYTYTYFLQSAGILQLGAGGSEKARITSGGSLLLGTTTDSGEKLQVLGSAKLEQTTNTNVEIKLNPYSSALGTSYAWNLVASNSATSYGFDIKQGTTSILHINNSAGGNNNIGIGTTSPSEKLEVDGIVKVTHTDNSYAKYRGQGVYFNRATSYLAPEVDNYGTLNVGYDGGRWGNVLINAAYVKFLNGATESMRISSSSNLLIGTTTDSGSKLQVTSNLNQQHLYIQGGYAEGIGALAQIKTTANGNALLVESATTSDSREILEVKNTNGTVFKVQGDGAATFSDVNGSILISGGNINLTDSAGGNMIILDSSSGDGVVRWEDGNVQKWDMGRDNTDNSWALSNTSGLGSSNVLTFAHSTGNANFSANVSIGGTAGAVYKLDVVGKQRVQSVLELEDVLTLNQISTPSDPASGKSSIYMDSADGAIKCKINVGGTVVVRTIASFE